MPYLADIRKHLADYKMHRLGISESGLAGNGRVYPYMLPKTLRQLTILESCRGEFWDFAATEFQGDRQTSLSSDLHDLTSAQALAFNLFFPFFAGRDLLPVLFTAMELRDRVPGLCRFAAVPDPAEGWVFDFCVDLEGGGCIFFSTLLSEADFGRVQAPTPGDRARLRSLYQPRLEGKVPDLFLREEVFFDHQNLLRQVSYLNPEAGDRLVLLYPMANEELRRREAEVRMMTSGALAECVRVMYLDDVVRSLIAATRDRPKDCAHFMALEEKYLVGA